MKKYTKSHKSSGFTLIELIFAMVIMSLGVVAISSMFSNVYKSRQFKRESGVNTELAQECAELLLSRSRDSYANISSTSCSSVTVGGYGPPVISAVTAGNSNTSASASWTATDWAACPYTSGVNCTLAKVSNDQRSISLMMVNH